MLKSIALAFTVLSVLFASSALAGSSESSSSSGFVSPFGNTTAKMGTCPFSREKPAQFGTVAAAKRGDKTAVGGTR